MQSSESDRPSLLWPIRVCLDAPNCKSFETWDFVDSKSWIGEATAPLLFDRDYQPKPAVAAMINEMLKK